MKLTDVSRQPNVLIIITDQERATFFTELGPSPAVTVESDEEQPEVVSA